jgi:hypothetical protein
VYAAARDVELDGPDAVARAPSSRARGRSRSSARTRASSSGMLNGFTT